MSAEPDTGTIPVIPLPEASTSSPPLSPPPADQPDSTSSIPLPPPPTSTSPTNTTKAVSPRKPPSTSLPLPRTKTRTKSSTTNGTAGPSSAAAAAAAAATAAAAAIDLHPMGITESIASAPNPRPTDFSYDPNGVAEQEIDIEAALEKAAADEDMPGSPTSKIMRAIAPPQASQADVKWPAPPPNASVNLFIGRALLANGNDNWPLKPNDIVNWIRKHYPSEWDGDEGRCSAHRVRTYLARKGADMYYEKLAQTSISGWRIRQNHLWRFENGGFQGRGMKQEDAMAEKAKEHELAITDRHKAAAAEALAAGHPGVKTSMSNPGTSDGLPAMKKTKVKGTGQGIGQARRRNMKKEEVDNILAGLQQQAQAQALAQQQQQQQQHQEQQQQQIQQHHQQNQPPPPPQQIPTAIDSSSFYSPTAYNTQPSSAGASSSQHHQPLDPLLSNPNNPSSTHPGTETGIETETDADPTEMDINMVHQAMQAAAGHIDDLDMGIQLPIEMQMHGDGDGDGDEHDRLGNQAGFYGVGEPVFGPGQGFSMGLGNGGAGYWNQGGYGYQQGQ